MSAAETLRALGARGSGPSFSARARARGSPLVSSLPTASRANGPTTLARRRPLAFLRKLSYGAPNAAHIFEASGRADQPACAAPGVAGSPVGAGRAADEPGGACIRARVRA